jgi:hypothetical protein
MVFLAGKLAPSFIMTYITNNFLDLCVYVFVNMSRCIRLLIFELRFLKNIQRITCIFWEVH